MYRRFLIVLILLLLAVVAGHQIGTLRDYPKGEGDFLDSPDGTHFATVLLLQTRRPFSRERVIWRVEVGHGAGAQNMARKESLFFMRDLPPSAFSPPFAIEQAITWSLDSRTVTFNSRPSPVVVAVPMPVAASAR